MTKIGLECTRIYFHIQIFQRHRSHACLCRCLSLCESGWSGSGVCAVDLAIAPGLWTRSHQIPAHRMCAHVCACLQCVSKTPVFNTNTCMHAGPLFVNHVGRVHAYARTRARTHIAPLQLFLRVLCFECSLHAHVLVGFIAQVFAPVLFPPQCDYTYRSLVVHRCEQEITLWRNIVQCAHTCS